MSKKKNKKIVTVKAPETTTNVLQTTISSPGTIFQLGEEIKDSTFPPGTEGYISYIMGPDHNNPNVVFHQVVTIRRGKKGKPRINVNIILSPIFSLPGVPMEFLVPLDVERKHLVDMAVVKHATKNILAETTTNEVSFLGQTLARALLAVELDKAIYPSNNRIMQTVGLPGHKVVNIWPKSKTSLLSRLTKETERLMDDGETGRLFNDFCNLDARISILNELKLVESCLTIPRLEYQRKVTTVLMAALDYIKIKLKEASEVEVPNKEELLKIVNNTKKMVKNKEYNVNKAIDTRLEAIVKNRTKTL